MSEFTLVDFDDETIAFVESKLLGIQHRQAPHAILRFLKRSAVQLIRSSGKEFVSSHDLVYCAGLFDYLADGVCVQLLRAFHDMLTAGGTLIVTNVQLPNPMHGTMTHLFDWHLECRDVARMRALWAQTGLQLEPSTYVEETTGNVFLEVTRDG
jgi:extracellular factor (EF) 3-hydroxypalmitic acid methyl ester biosynthesis protein